MIRAILLSLLLSSECFALEAVVTVLETPMFREKNLNSQVVQYLRKGDVISIHGSVDRITKYDHMAPHPAKLAELNRRIEADPARFDPMFSGKTPELINPEVDEFIPVVDRQGLRAYVLSQHLYIYYENMREMGQTTIQPDPTDYRLEEPLPKHYPLFTFSGYRGLGFIGVTQPYNESYPYNSTVRMKGYMSPLDFNYVLLRKTPDDVQDRFFIGGVLGVRYFENSYLLENLRLSEETGLKVSLGPYIAFDAYKGEKNRINLHGSIHVNFFNQLNIAQSFGSERDLRNYRALTLAPRLGAQYHRKKIMPELDLDFVLGTYLEVESAGTYHAQNAGRAAGWWQSNANDSFRTRPVFSLALFLGLQTAY
jgi:hypothetical protein